jgi:hypothetical protein
MFKLLRKDVILNGRVLALAYAFWSAFWLGYPVLRPGGDPSFNAWAVMVSVPCAVLPVIGIAREDKFKGGALACSLPVTRDAIATSRYVGGWLIAVVGAAIAVGAMAILSAAGMTEFAPPTIWLPAEVVVTIGLALAVLLPFTLRFGITGVLVFGIGAQLAGIVVLLAAAIFGSTGGVGAIIRGTAKAVNSTREALGPGVFVLAVMAAIAALNVASHRVSVWIYRRREF